jgi:hypothetical protein
MMDELVIGLVLALCAVLGAGLGVANLVRSQLSDAERVRAMLFEGGPKEYAGIKIVNVSAFPIWMKLLGNVYIEGKTDAVTLQFDATDGAQLPQKIEARSAHLFQIDVRETIARALQKPLFTYAAPHWAPYSQPSVGLSDGVGERWSSCT